MFHKVILGNFYNNLATPAQTLSLSVSLSLSLSLSDCFEAKLKSRVLKVPIPEEFFHLDTVSVVSRQGVHRAFEYNYTSFFSDIIKKYNPFLFHKFTRNFIRREDSRKQKHPNLMSKLHAKRMAVLPRPPYNS